jgi:hypothetical protein
MYASNFWISVAYSRDLDFKASMLAVSNRCSITNLGVAIVALDFFGRLILARVNIGLGRRHILSSLLRDCGVADRLNDLLALTQHTLRQHTIDSCRRRYGVTE